jgi:hypothetical protein
LFFKIGFANYLPRLASNLNPPDLCLLSSWDYRGEPLVPGSGIKFKRVPKSLVIKQYVNAVLKKLKLIQKNL